MERRIDFYGQVRGGKISLDTCRYWVFLSEEGSKLVILVRVQLLSGSGFDSEQLLSGRFLSLVSMLLSGNGFRQ